MKKIFLCAILALSIFSINNEIYCENKFLGSAKNIAKNLSKQFFTKEGLKNYGKYLFAISKKLPMLYFSILSHTLSHEFGHAIAAKILYGSNLDIHLGPERKKVRFKIGCVKFRGLNPLHWAMMGYSITIKNIGFKEIDPKKLQELLENPKKLYLPKNKDYLKYVLATAYLIKKDRLKDFIINIAGGAFGAGADLLYFAGSAAHKKYKESKDIGSSLLYGATNALTPYKNIRLNKKLKDHELRAELAFTHIKIMQSLHMMLSSFTPGGYGYLPFPDYGADGTRAWENFGAGKTVIKIGSVGQMLAKISAIILPFLKGNKEYKKYYRDKFCRNKSRVKKNN